MTRRQEANGLPRGRHRARRSERARRTRIREATTSALWGANGTLATAAVAALVLAGQQGTGGLLAEPPGAFLPTDVGPEGSAPGATLGDAAQPAITPVASARTPGAGADWGDSAWDRLLRLFDGNIAAALASLCDAATAAIFAPANGASPGEALAALTVVRPGAQAISGAAAAQPGFAATAAQSWHPVTAARTSRPPAPGCTTPAQSSGGAAGSLAALSAPRPAPRVGGLFVAGPVPPGPVGHGAAPVAEPVTQPVREVVAERAEVLAPVAQPVSLPVAEPVREVVAPVAEPVAEPVREVVAPVTEPVAEPVLEVVAPVTEPVAQPVAEPVSLSVAEPVLEAAPPLTQPVQQAVQPVTQPVTQTVAPATEALPGPADLPSTETSTLLVPLG